MRYLDQYKLTRPHHALTFRNKDSGEVLASRFAKEILVLGKEDAALRSFIEKLRSSKKLIVQIDEEEFLLELQPLQVSNETRTLLITGGPIKDRGD